MKTELKQQILYKIRTKSLKAFSCYDFTDFSSYKTISKCLERMEDGGEIKRIVQGVYCVAKLDNQLSLPILPSVDDVVNCIARKHKWAICPTSNTALNIMGLSTQVPASYSYLSNGPYKNYEIYGINVSLKRTMNRELSDYSYKTLLLIQCIKAIGKDNISDSEISSLKNKLTSGDKIIALVETNCLPTWIRNVVVKICKEC